MAEFACQAQIPEPPGSCGGGGSTNYPPPSYNPTPQVPEQGAIIASEMTHDVIEWWNFNNHVFEVEWRATLTDGSWTNIGEGYNTFEHQYPEGFYRVIERPDKAVQLVWNNSTTNMIWSASTTCEWLSVECLNTNIPPEWGEGYVIVSMIDIPEEGSKGVYRIIGSAGGIINTQDCTIIFGEL
jgi:hypothetical protein